MDEQKKDEQKKDEQKKATLTVPEAAGVVGVNHLTLYAAIRRGEFPAVKVGRRVVVPRVALERWLAAASETS